LSGISSKYFGGLHGLEEGFCLDDECDLEGGFLRAVNSWGACSVRNSRNDFLGGWYTGTLTACSVTETMILMSHLHSSLTLMSHTHIDVSHSH